MLSAILNTWLPRSNFIYSNNTLLTAGCCKSKRRYLKHWYRLLCPGLVKPILGHMRYTRLFHTPRTSFLLTTRRWKHNSCSSLIFIPGKNLRERPLEPFRIPLCVSIHKITTWNQNTLLVFTCGRWRQGRIVCYPDSGCVTRFARWLCVRLLFSLLPLSPPPPKISSPLAP